jgi:hypothetical protein
MIHEVSQITHFNLGTCIRIPDRCSCWMDGRGGAGAGLSRLALRDGESISAAVRSTVPLLKVVDSYVSEYALTHHVAARRSPRYQYKLSGPQTFSGQRYVG